MKLPCFSVTLKYRFPKNTPVNEPIHLRQDNKERNVKCNVKLHLKVMFFIVIKDFLVDIRHAAVRFF